MIIEDKKWFFCTKCRCRATGNVGYYQLSHNDTTLNPDWKPEGNVSPIDDPDPTPHHPLRPRLDEPSDDDLVFTGVNHTPVLRMPRPLDERKNGTESGETMKTNRRREIQSEMPSDNGPRNHVIDLTLFSNTVTNSVQQDLSLNNVTIVSTDISSVPDNCADSMMMTSMMMGLTSTCTYLVDMIYQVVLVLIQVLRAVHKEVEDRMKYLVLLSTSSFWFTVHYLCTSTSLRTSHIKAIPFGFPAKWLILTAVMFFATFCTGNYFEINSTYTTIFNNLIKRNLSIKRTVHLPQCTWNMLLEYNMENWTVIKEQFGQVANVLGDVNSMDNVNLIQSVKVPMNERTTAHDTNKDLWIDVIPQIKTHKINTTGNTLQQDSIISNTAPAVSIKAGLELILPTDLQVNQATNVLVPIIFDTGASLAITGDKQDFLPNTFKEVTSLKLGGMAAGALITGAGNVAWTFSCENGDNLAIITRCYLVPSANTRLLSPQGIFDKHNGNAGKFWGDEEKFHLHYQDKPTVSVEYSNSSNLPIGYALTTATDSSAQINLALLEDENQNLTAGQKLLLEYHFRFGHTNMPLIQQILRSDAFPAGKFAAATKCQIPKCAICEYAKGHRRSTKGKTHIPNQV